MSKKIKKEILIVFSIVLLIGITGCSNGGTKSSSSTESVNRCGDTTSEHYAKTRKCNAKDNERQNCEYSNCTCTCRPK